MATVTRENLSLLNDKLTVQVSKDDYFPAFDKALKQYSKTANIPGFRKGMVPAGLIKKMHGPSIFTDEVVKSVEKELGRFMTEEKLDIFAQPLPIESETSRPDMNNPGDYSFHFEIGLRPAVDLDIKKVKATRYKINIADEMINEEIDRLQNRFGKVLDKESVTTDEDILNVSIVESDAQGTPLEGATPKENSLLVKYFAENTRSQLTGKQANDTLILQLGSAFDEKEREWLVKDLSLDEHNPAELEKYFLFTITKVGLLEKRELTPELFNEVFPNQNIETEAAFRDRIKQEVANQFGNQSRDFLHHELYHHLLDDTHIELPEKFLKRWLQVGGEKPKTAEEAEEEFPTFKSQLKWTLISDKLIRENSLDVSPEELREFMRQQVMGYFGSMNLEGDNANWIDSYVERMLKDEQQVESTYRRLVTDKMFTWAEGQVKVTEKPIAVEEFAKLQHAHSHEH